MRQAPEEKIVNELRRRYDYLFTTGGIGPTHDDITSECVAAASLPSTKVGAISR
jgi:molybdopterin-biosynthesis enzyme MoeA-like protein